MTKETAKQEQEFTQAPKAETGKPALTPQQQRFRKKGSKALVAYKNLMVANKGWLYLSGFEIYNLLFSGLPGIVGMGLRNLSLRLFTKSYGKGTVVGRDVLIRQPSRVALGRGVIIDDFSVLDVRDSGQSSEDEPNIDGPSITVEDFSFIGRNTSVVAKGASITLGKGCNISSFCRIASETSIEIGESVLIASYVYIGPGNHHRDQETGRVVVEAEMEKRGGVSIGSGCWIGTRATILDGVKIGKNAIIGAHSLVREDVPDGAVVAGVPAKIISQIQE